MSHCQKHRQARPFLNPRLVFDQYEKLREELACDEFGIPLAPEPYDKLFGGGSLGRLPAASHMRGDAVEYWRRWQQKRTQFAAERGNNRRAEEIAGRKSAGVVDISIIAQAISTAETGAEVYVASSDFKDVVNPLLNCAEEFRCRGLGIKVLPPSDVNPAYFGTDFELKGAVTGEVLRELQAASEPAQYTIVVFEKVRSRNAEFPVGVGVVQKRYWRPLELSPSFESIPKACRELVPVLRVKSLEGVSQREENKIGDRIAGLALELNVRKVVIVQDDKPYKPLLVGIMDSLLISSPDSNLTTRLFRADLNYLCNHAMSLYASANCSPKRG